MAIDFASSSGLYIADSSLDNLNDFSWLMWIYTDSTSTASQVYCMKDDPDLGRRALERKFGDVDDFEAILFRSGSNALASTTGVNKPTNTWFFVAVTFSESEAGGPKIYTGDLNTLATEASYSSRTNGTGLLTDDSANGLCIGALRQDTPSFASSMFGKMGTFQAFNTALSLNQIRSFQFLPRAHANSILLYQLGNSGTTTQVDHSGNGLNGTYNGTCTVADHVPLRPPFAMTGEFPFPVSSVVAPTLPPTLAMMGVGA